MKIQTSATGYNKQKNGFTLLELLVVILIIGIASSVVLINTTSIERIMKGGVSVERNFQIMSEESILSSKILGWFPGNSFQKIYILDASGNKDIEYNSESLSAYWNSISEYQKIIKGSDGEEVELNAEITDYPVITFFPSGENSGAELYIYRDEYIQQITISQNGKINNETKIK